LTVKGGKSGTVNQIAASSLLPSAQSSGRNL
jgi:hypothetical protein